MKQLLADLSEALQNGRTKLVQELVERAMEEGIPAKTILEEGLMAGMAVIGEKFKNNEVYVPHVIVAARAMNAGTAMLGPLLTEEGVRSRGRVCLGTVQGDLHDIGKNLVRLMLEGRGFEVVDLGTDVPPEKFVEAVQNEGCQIVALSALLTTTMVEMGEVIEALKTAGLRDKVKIIVGGAPVSEQFAVSIGADAYAPDAATAADTALGFVS